MAIRFIKPIRAASIVFLGMMLLLSGCGGLSSEPTIISTAPVPTVTPTLPPDVGHPTARIDLEDGATIYNGAQGCQNCHGVGGQGNGTVSANFTCQIPNVSDPAVARPASVDQWFSVTTNGNGGDTSCLMPPWNTTLTEQQRWDVTSYFYSLHYSATQLAAGATIWQANCSACHGVQGAGDGPQSKTSAKPLPNFADPAALIGQSDTDLYNSITNGVGSAMPAYAKTLDDSSRWAVTAYLRSLAWDHVDTVIASGGSSDSGAAPATAAATASAASTPVVDSTPLTVTGTLINGTPGGTVPASLPITLHIIQTTTAADGSATSQDTDVIQGTAINGKFSFADVPRRAGQAYAVTTSYAGVQQFSIPLQAGGGTGAQIDLPLTIYELGAPADSIAVTQETLVFDFPDADTIMVTEGLNFQNTSNRISYALTADGKQHASIALPLPDGTGNVQIAPEVIGEFSLISSTNPTQPGQIVSTLPLLPGETRPLQLTYTLQINHANGTATVVLPTPYTIQTFNLYLPQPSGLTISDPHYPTAAANTFTDSNGQSVAYDGFQLAAPQPAGQPLSLVLQSKAALINADADAQRNTLAIVITLALAVFAVTGFIVYRIGRVSRLSMATSTAVASANGGHAAPVVSTDLLIRQMAALDDQLARQAIDPAEYEARRDQLKAQLMQAIARAESAAE